jgi:hypothetical protein
MHKQILPLGFALLFLLVSGCARASRQAGSADVHMSLTAVPFPARVGESRLVIQIADENDRPVDKAHLQIKGDMTHSGMVPVLAEIDGGTGGLYEIPFEWTMAGDWVVTVDLRLPDGATAQQRFEMSVHSEADDICEDDEPES